MDEYLPVDPDTVRIIYPQFPFWIVLSDPRNMNATKRHDTEAAARAEAERLCRKQRQPFFVCRVGHAAKVEPAETPVIWTML